MKKHILILSAVLLTLGLSASLHAFPDEQKGSAIDLGLLQAKRMFLSNDQRYIWMVQGNLVTRIDDAMFELTSVQPYAISTDTTTYTGNFEDFLYLENFGQMYVTEDNGNMLLYPLNQITAAPSIVAVNTGGAKLTFIQSSTDGQTLYILTDAATNPGLIIYKVGEPAPAPVLLKTLFPTPLTYAVKSFLFVPNAGPSGQLYAATDVGIVYVMSPAGSALQAVTIDVAHQQELAGMAKLANDTKVYVVNNELSKVNIIDTASLTLSATVIDLSAVNNTLTQILITDVTNPSAQYAYVSGAAGVSVIDTASNLIIDCGTTATADEPIPTTSQGLMVNSTDGYLYMSDGGGRLVVFSALPFITYNSVTYSNGQGYIGLTDSVTIDWQSDTDGTYKEYVGGTITETGGTAFLDSTGSNTGAAVAAVPISQTFNYADNAAALVEGANDIFFFVTDGSGNRGRRATTVQVNVPPPLVNVQSTGFGRNKIYVNMTRLTEPDIDHYNIYADVDPTTVITTPTVSGVVTQPSAGSTVTGEATGLVNGSVYYIAVEAVDTVGQISASRTYTYSDGSRITGRPEDVVGPAGYSGETGCSMLPVKNGERDLAVYIAGLLISLSAVYISRRRLSKKYLLLVVAMIGLVPSIASAEEKTPQWWSTEVKANMWMPQAAKTKHFIDQCCNMGASVDGGFLYDSKYGVELGIGFMYITGDARGQLSGEQAQDTFTLILMPMETNFVFRADFKENQLLVPFVRAGVDYVFFHESTAGNTVKGIKYGLHGGGGLQILLDGLDSGDNLERDFGINDVYLTLEGRYNWINSFGSGGLDLSGPMFSVGFLFEY